MDTDSDAWNERYKTLTARIALPTFREREVWWCVLGLNVGSEQNGAGTEFRRPVIVVRKFSRNLFFAVPLTSRPKRGGWYLPLKINGREVGSAILIQARVLDARRLVNRIGVLSPENFALLGDRMKKVLFQNGKPPP